MLRWRLGLQMGALAVQLQGTMQGRTESLEDFAWRFHGIYEESNVMESQAVQQFLWNLTDEGRSIL
jgi:hypothetical protein